MRKYYWYLTAYSRKHGKLIVLSLISAILFFWLLIPQIITYLDQKPRRYIGVVGEYELTTLPLEIQTLISAGLTRLDPDGTIGPAAAERWSIEDDGTTYRFIVRKDLLWQDGKPFEPSDVKYNFSDAETITTQNDVVFKLPDTFVPFPSAVSKPLFRTIEVPHYFFFTKEKILGLGEYEIISISYNGSRIDELVLDGQNDRRIYRFYLTEKRAREAFKHGSVDFLLDIIDPDDLLSWDKIATERELHFDRYLAVFFNINNPLFPKNIRQALNYALPKPDNETRAIGPINPLSWVYFEGGKGYEYDLERGIERMMSEPPNSPLSFNLVTTPTFLADAEAIKTHWETFGQQASEHCKNDSDVKDVALCENMLINVNIRINNFPDTSDFEALLIGQEIPHDPDQYPLWHSEQPTNFTGYKNTRIDSLLERGRQVFEREDRRAIYQEFQQFFLEDSPAVFIRYLESYSITREE